MHSQTKYNFRHVKIERHRQRAATTIIPANITPLNHKLQQPTRTYTSCFSTLRKIVSTLYTLRYPILLEFYIQLHIYLSLQNNHYGEFTAITYRALVLRIPTRMESSSDIQLTHQSVSLIFQNTYVYYIPNKPYML